MVNNRIQRQEARRLNNHWDSDTADALRNLCDSPGWNYLKTLAGVYPRLLRGTVLPQTAEQRANIADAGVLEITLEHLFTEIEHIAAQSHKRVQKKDKGDQ